MDQSPTLPAALAADALSVVIDPARLGFKTTAEIDAVDQVPCQARALEAIRFGTGIRSPGFNLFLLGSHGTGRHSLIEAFLTGKAAAESDGDDWVYVENFDLPHMPRALRLPAGRGQDLADAIMKVLRSDTAPLEAELRAVMGPPGATRRLVSELMDFLAIKDRPHEVAPAH